MMKIVKVLSTFLAVLFLVSNVESQDCNSPFTAYIVLDGSKSIRESNFATVKNAVKNFTAETINRNNGNKIGIVVYSDTVTYNITATSDITSLANKIDTIRYPKAGTATDKGILFARQQLQREHSFNRRVMIVITDGNSNELNKTLEAAREAKDDGITIFAVGIDEEMKHLGNLYENFEAELINIASFNTLVYRTGLFKDLSTPLFEVLQQLCQHVVSVVKPLDDLTVVEGSTVIFRVMLTDPEVTNVVWRRYGKEVNRTDGYLKQVEGRNHTLTRRNIRHEQSGEYSFTLGNATSQCILTVIGKLRDINAKIGDEAYFRTYVSPAPITGGKWFKGGEPIFFPSSKYTITSQPTLRSLLVRNVTDSSNGLYTFTLNNVSTSGSLIVEGPIVDGGWSAWQDTSICPVTCGLDAMKRKTKVRNCTNPTPSVGGKPCDGRNLEIESVNCNLEECIVNGEWSAWAAWRSTCDNKTCGENSTTRALRERECDSPPPSTRGLFCIGEKFETDTMLCQRVPCAGLCDDVTEKDGVGYRYHPSDCDKYVQCYSNLDGHVLASVRTCPAGFYWNQAKFKCQESRRVICPLESYSSSRMSMKKIPGSCRSYWLKEERSQARCCPLSFSFVEGKGCRLNKDCQDLCPQPFEHRCVCDKRPLWLSISPSYQLFNSERGWVNTSCPSGTVFDLADCGCSDMARDICDSSYTLMFNASAFPVWISSTDVTYTDGDANFFGSGMMTFDVDLGAKFDPIKIQFRYKEKEETTGTKILLRSNCYDNDDDLAVHVDEEAISVRVKSGNKEVEEYALPTLGIKHSDWKTVTLLYDGRRFVITVESGSVRYSGYLYVYGSDFAQCQMVFGSERGSTSTNAFSGSLSMISFSQCGSGLTA